MDGVFLVVFFAVHTLPDNKFLPLVFGGEKCRPIWIKIFFFFWALRVKLHTVAMDVNLK